MRAAPRKTPAVAADSNGHHQPWALIIDDVENYWQSRRCFVCQGYGACGHREIAVATAEAQRLQFRRRKAG